ncbi:MAG: putative rane protein [Chlamydiales bacterium]|nr:putative rane protein [Chlamydiales bacterium]
MNKNIKNLSIIVKLANLTTITFIIFIIIKNIVIYLSNKEINIEIPSFKSTPFIENIVYHGKNSRPDSISPMYSLTVKTNVGEHLLKLTDQAPTRLNNIDLPLILSAIDTESIQLELQEESAKKVYDIKRNSQKLSSSLKKIIDDTKIVWYGPDLFLRYTKVEKIPSKDKIYLEICFQEKVVSYFLSENQRFIWKNGQWTVPLLSNETQDYPLLEISLEKDTNLKIKIWDLLGIEPHIIKLRKSISPKLSDHLFDNWQFLEAQTLHKGLLLIKDKTFSFCKGDLWLHTVDRGWYNLKTDQELLSYRERKIEGELLVIQNVSYKSRKQILNALLFNNKHSQVYDVCFESKNAGAKIKLKTNFF